MSYTLKVIWAFYKVETIYYDIPEKLLDKSDLSLSAHVVPINDE